MKLKPSKTEGAAAVACSALLGIINVTTLILIIIVAIGQRGLYRRLANAETKIEALAKQQSLQKSSPAQQQ